MATLDNPMQDLHIASGEYRDSLPNAGFDAFSMSAAFEAGATWAASKIQQSEDAPLADDLLLEARKGLRALYLEVDESIAKDVENRVEAAFKAIGIAAERQGREQALGDIQK